MKDKENQNVRPSKVAAKKKLAILKAAMELFRRHGFKRASIDLIAEAAKVAKPTIYAHFADKEALFAAVCGLFVERVASDARAALLHADVTQRFTAFLSAKFTFYFDVVLRSPYASELLDATNELAREMIAASDQSYREMLIGAIKESDARGEICLQRARLDAASLADTLLQAGHGAEYQSKTTEEHRANLQRLVTLLLGASVSI